MPREQKPAGSRSEYILCIKEKQGRERMARVGAAWARKNGGFNIVLNPGTVLHWNDDLYISLFPNDGNFTAPKSSREDIKSDGAIGEDTKLDDPIPF